MKVDICFVIDCTSSMGRWIEEAKYKTVEMVKDICDTHEGAEVRVAFVGYRDYGDKDKLILVDFTSSEAAQAAIQTIEAEGGRDAAEDVATALFHVLGLNWTGDIKFVVHIADAPAHGSCFHKPKVSDSYPEGDPDGRDPRDSIEKFSFLNIDYAFVQISRDTDVMVEAFKECYRHGGTFKELELFPHDDAETNFSASVTHHLISSITWHTSSPAR